MLKEQPLKRGQTRFLIITSGKSTLSSTIIYKNLRYSLRSFFSNGLDACYPENLPFRVYLKCGITCYQVLLRKEDTKVLMARTLASTRKTLTLSLTQTS